MIKFSKKGTHQITIKLLVYFFCVLKSFTGFANNLTTEAKIGDSKIAITLQPLDLKNRPLDSIPLNKLIKVKVLLNALTNKSSKLPKLEIFNANMPKHRHGMITKPVVKMSSESEYIVEGVKLHMPGEWQLNMQFGEGKNATQVAIPLKL